MVNQAAHLLATPSRVTLSEIWYYSRSRPRRTGRCSHDFRFDTGPTGGQHAIQPDRGKTSTYKVVLDDKFCFAE